ncbi:MAG: hypothetical protein KA257_04685 [Opitutaceae bacterium]|nr:hypothetical protein [Opitutaceae bacterium]MBP9911799.1 hypothetical protein [Opitutaceae bacterium]
MALTDQTITCEQLAGKIRPFMHTQVKTLAAICLGIAIWMYFSDRNGVMPFLVISAGALLPIFAWNAQRSSSLPLGPLIALQSLIIYATPVVTQNPSVFVYSNEEIMRAAVEIFIFCASLAAGWLLAFKNSFRRAPATYLKFKFLNSDQPRKLVNFGVLLISLSVGYHVANMAGWLGLLPSGLYPIIRTMGDSAGMGGGLLSGYFIGLGELRGPRQTLFWIIFLVHCVFTASNYTLFPVTSLIIAVSVGIFLGRGKVPIVLLAVFTMGVGFLNLSKFEMRSAYWLEGTAYAPQELSSLSDRYEEWISRSWGHFTDSDEFKSDREHIASQRISDRINNLVNLLDVQEYVTMDNVPVLGGETYTIIPALLIPRLFWPDKPRTHEGMVLLNVHFGKQTEEESFVTYISWGLLPEAYGNFGPIFGALFCGGVIGLIMGWLESWSRHYPLISLQALIFLSMLVQFGSSFEMVASLWVTSVFQMVLATIGGTFLLVTKTPFARNNS